jgi:maleamate amidohydrolase
VIAGVWTEATVAATVRDAVAAGLRVLIVKDACASGSELMHRTATLNLGNRLHGGGILDAIRAADLLSGREARVWMLEEVSPFQYIPETVAPLYNAL